MAKREVIVLWVYEPNGALFTKHVVPQGWNAVQAIDIIRKKFGGLWNGEGDAFLPWHNFYKIVEHKEVEEVPDGEETDKEGSVHGDRQTSDISADPCETEGEVYAAGQQGSTVESPGD
jgi:hypothetical protein